MMQQHCFLLHLRLITSRIAEQPQTLDRFVLHGQYCPLTFNSYRILTLDLTHGKEEIWEGDIFEVV